MWKWGGKPQSKCYMVRLGNLIFQGDPLFFIFLYFSLFMTIFFHLFHGWLSQPVHSAVPCVFCCSVAPFPHHWVRDGQRNGEEKEYLNKLQTSCREEITFLMQSFSSTGAVKSAMPIFSVFRLFSFFKCHQNAENSVLTLLDDQNPALVLRNLALFEVSEMADQEKWTNFYFVGPLGDG